jgi:hypothetical protein
MIKELNNLRKFSRLIVFVILGVSVQLGAQEAFVHAGLMEDTDSPDKDSYSWSLEYFEGISEHVGFSFSWINEGHVMDHHRDGHSTQIWFRNNILDRRLSLKAGIGPYRFFDTTGQTEDGGYVNAHGWGVVYSVGGVWYTHSPWVFQLKANFIDTFGSVDTATILLGLGYQLEPTQRPGPRAKALDQTEYTTDQEITVFLGQTFVNSFGSKNGIASSVEYRRGLSRHVDVTIAWINEGDTELIRRNGITVQLWLTRGFFDNCLTLGAGGGVYYSIDKYRDSVQSEASERSLGGLITMSGSYRFSDRWLTRISWNRVASDYNRDTDIFLLGLGYQF